MTNGSNSENARVSFEAGGSPRLRVEDSTAMNECIERLVLACNQSLRVQAKRLDYDFYYSDAFVQACLSVIKRDLRNELQFLVEDEWHLMKTNVKLVGLARRYSSYIKLRVIPEEYIEQREMFVLCDASGCLHQPSVDHPTGFLSTSDRGTVRQFSRRFKDLWERSSQPTELFTTGL